MLSEDDNRAAVGMMAAAIRAAVAGVQLVPSGVECFYPKIGERVRLRLTREDQSSPTWVRSISAGDDAFTPIHRTAVFPDAVTSFIWADRMLRTRFAELQDLLSTGVIPRCVSNCDDLHNFVDWNMAGDAEELIEAGDQIHFDVGSGPMAWPCSILNGVDQVIGWWLTRHAEPSLAPAASAEQMAGLLCSFNPVLEQQVAERFLRMNHSDAREFLRRAAGHDGSNLTMKVMALVQAAARINHSLTERTTMGPHLSIAGARDGQVVPLPQDLDAITITTQQGTIYIDLAEQVQNMVLMRASVDSHTSEVVRLIVSPMESGGLAVGVIRTPS